MSRHGKFQIHQRLEVHTVELKDVPTGIKQAEGGDNPHDIQPGGIDNIRHQA